MNLIAYDITTYHSFNTYLEFVSPSWTQEIEFL